MALSNWLSRARHRAVIRRALASSLVVGPILIVSNHGDAIMQGDISRITAFKMALTVIVRY